MSHSVHVVQAAVSAAVLYPVVGEAAIPFGVAVVLIDLDHIITYLWDTGDWTFRGFFIYNHVILQNMHTGYLNLSLFHTVEFYLLCLLLASWQPLRWIWLDATPYRSALSAYNQTSDWLGDGVLYSCVHQMDDHVGKLAHRHTKTLGWITCGSKKQEIRNRRLVGFQALKVALLQAASAGSGLDPFSASFAAWLVGLQILIGNHDFE